MLKHRLILSLLMQDRYFMNSRNFTVQKVANLETVLQYLNLDAIDELVILNVKRGDKNIVEFSNNIKEVAKKCFVPISAGGGVSKLEDFDNLFRSGADKIIINTAAIENPELINEAARAYGTQCVVVSVDVKKTEEGKYEVFSNNGTKNANKECIEWVKEAGERGAGEIFLTSIDRDGLGVGYDIELIKTISDAVSIPVVASGGVGEFQHLVDGVSIGNASAVSFANLFHFIGHGLLKAKIYIGQQGLDFPHPLWNF